MVSGYAAAATALLALSGVNSFGKCTCTLRDHILVLCRLGVVSMVAWDFDCNQI